MSNKLTLEIKELKNIPYFKGDFPMDKGIYVISGENGVGKSTIFAALSQIIYYKRMAINKGLNTEPLNRNPQNKDTYISYEYEGVVNKFKFYGVDIANEDGNNKKSASNKWKMEDRKSSKGNPTNRFNGFCELNIPFGRRFVLTKDLFKIIETVLSDKNNYEVDTSNILRDLGFILKSNNQDYYYNNFNLLKIQKKAIDSKLKEIKDRKKSNQKLNKVKNTIPDSSISKLARIIENSNIFILQEKESGKMIYPFEFSTGENLLLQILDFFRDIKTGVEVQFILIDEVETGLYPYAQKQLMGFLDKLANEHNICIYLSTHSPNIINNIPNLGNLYEFKRVFENDGEQIKLEQKPIATLLQSISKEVHFDKYIVVEDELAKTYVEKVLETMNNIDFIVKVFSIGTWQSVINFYDEMNMYENDFSRKIIPVIDGDVKQDIYRKIKNESERNINQECCDKFNFDNQFKFLGKTYNDKILSSVESDGNFEKFLYDYKQALKNYNQTKCIKDESILNYKFKQLTEKAAQLITQKKIEQYTWLPVPSLEKYIVYFILQLKEKKQSYDSMVTLVISQSSNKCKTSLEEFLVNDCIQQIDCLGLDLSNYRKKGDPSKEVYKSFCAFLKNNYALSPECIITEIIYPLIEKDFSEELKELKEFLANS